jgi:hypothetical protein
MNDSELMKKIAEKDFDVDEFVELTITNEKARDEIVYQMISNSKIMTYYHCYYIVEKATRKHPELFYQYWHDIADLIHHTNSYHRDFGLDIIGNLIKVDKENRFIEIEDDYFTAINDEKFMTGNCCVKNMLKIFLYKVDLRKRVVEILLDIDNHCDYTEKQKAVLKSDVLEVFDEVYGDAAKQDEINEFIRAEINSISPKTRKKARELIQKYIL